MDTAESALTLKRRELLNKADAARLGRLFRLMSGASRVRLLHAIAREGEAPVGRLAEAVGLSIQATSNQLNRLADRGLVAARRNGRHVLYRLVDPRAEVLLEQAWSLLDSAPAPGKGR